MKVLFLDRDGVINVENKGGYILDISEFQFHEGVPEAIQIFNRFFDKIIVVTNQRCVGKGLITDEQLREIHDHMKETLHDHQARIDDIFYAPNIEDNHPDRKPEIGMGLQAQNRYPEIDFSESVMVGNNISDMIFGKKLGMHTVFLSTTSEYNSNTHDKYCELHFESLKEFADFYNEKQSANK